MRLQVKSIEERDKVLRKSLMVLSMIHNLFSPPHKALDNDEDTYIPAYIHTNAKK